MLKMTIVFHLKDRIKTFGFSHTFKGKIVEDSQDTVEGKYCCYKSIMVNKFQ